MDTVIRWGSVVDATQLSRLRWESRDYGEKALEPYQSFETRFAAWLVRALQSGEWHVAVASAPESLTGCMYLREVDTVPVPGVDHRRWGYVTHAYVRPARRGRGIGRELLDQIIARASERGLHELHVWPSEAAVSLYTRAGFQSPEMQRQSVPSDEPSYVLPLRAKPG